MPEKFELTSEQQREMASRARSDAELIKGGAEYSKKGELILTEEQKNVIHNEMMGNLNEIEKKDFFDKSDYYGEYMKSNEILPEKVEDTKKLDKLFSDMNEQVSQIDNLVNASKNESLKSDVEILKEAINGGLEKMFDLQGEDAYCCLGDTGYDIKQKVFVMDGGGVLFQIGKKRTGNYNMDLALDRLWLEVLKMVVYKKSPSGYDKVLFYEMAKKISEETGVARKDVIIGIINRLKSQKVKVDGDKIEVVEQAV